MSDTWDEKRIQSYIDNKIEESASLDYKAAGALSTDSRVKDSITKDVSAFANSNGGVIIYGLREFNPKDKQYLAERIDPIDRRNFSKEWLEQIIAGIQPRLKVQITPVQLASAAEHVAYVVEIPAGQTAYQAADLRYYRRYNFESVPMADYEIRDVMRRRMDPVVKTGIKIFFGAAGISNRVRWTVRNESDVFVRYASSRVEIPFLVSGHAIRFEDEYRVGSVLDDDGFTAWHLYPGNNFAVPLFPRGFLSEDFRFRLVTVGKTEGEPLRARDVVRYTTFADHMIPVMGEFRLQDIILKETLKP